MSLGIRGWAAVGALLVSGTAAGAVPGPAAADSATTYTVVDLGTSIPRANPIRLNGVLEALTSGGLWVNGTLRAPATHGSERLTLSALGPSGIAVGQVYTGTLNGTRSQQYVPAYWDSAHSEDYVKVDPASVTVNGQPGFYGSFFDSDADGELVGSVQNANGNQVADVDGLFQPGSAGTPQGQVQDVSSVAGTPVQQLFAISDRYELGLPKGPQDFYIHRFDRVGGGNVTTPYVTGVKMADDGTVGGQLNTSAGTLGVMAPDGSEMTLAGPGGSTYAELSGIRPLADARTDGGPVAVGMTQGANAVAEVWDASGAISTLQSHLADQSWTVTAASGIDDEGDITATATTAGVQHGVILVPTTGASVSVADTSVGEPSTGTTTADVPVTLSKAVDKDVTVHYATSDGTATTAHGDYDQASGTVTIPAGSTTATFQVTIHASGLTEDKTVVLTISNLSSDADVSLGTTSATLTISDKSTIKGTIEARSGRPVGAATVVMTPSGGTGSPVTTQTDSGGNFTALVDPGTYSVAPQPADGRWVPTNGGDCTASTTACSVTVNHGQTAAVDFTTALKVDAITVQQPIITNAGSFGDLVDVPDSGTYDGNALTITITMSNTSSLPVTTPLDLGRPALTSDSTAPALSAVSVPPSVTVPANGSVKVEAHWDTNGAAWTPSGSPDPTHIVRVTPSVTPAAYNQSTVTVRPRPVIMAHGLFSDASTWAAYQDLSGFLHQANPLWQGFAVGDGAYPGTMNTSPFDPNANSIAGNATEEARYIRGVRSGLDAAHVDIVAHSMGGLISRQYIATLMPGSPGDGRPVVTHLAMLGTPNLGSPCAYPGSAALYYLGVKLAGGGLPVAQLQPNFATTFNRTVTDRKGVAFSILAGDAMPTTCGAPEDSDEVVPLSSALWTIGDHTIVNGLFHTSMTASRPAFQSWVLPHLRAAGSTPAAQRQAARSGARGAVTAGTVRVHPGACRAKTGGVSGLVGGGYSVLTPGRTVTRTVRIGRGTSLDLVSVHQPGLTVSLSGPHGILRSSAAGSPTDQSPFTSLHVANPRPGRWRVTLTTTRPSLPVAWSLTERGSHEHLAARVVSRGGVAREIVARLRGASAARVAATVTVGARRVRVTLRRVPGHPGRFVVVLPKRLRSDSLQALVRATGPRLSIGALISAYGTCG